MPLTPGTPLGPYSVTAQIGAGGMGEVYRARDTKLDRDVARRLEPHAATSIHSHRPDAEERSRMAMPGVRSSPLTVSGSGITRVRG